MSFRGWRSLTTRMSCVMFVGIVLGNSSSKADILVEENFSHPDGDLVGQVPTPGPGDAWEQFDDPNNGVPIQVSSGAAVLSQGTGSGGRQDAQAGFTPRSATDITYARFDFTLPSGQSLDDPNQKVLDDNGLYFALFYSGLPTTGFRARTGVIQPPNAVGDFGLAMNASGSRLSLVDGASHWPADLFFDTIYRTVISYDADSGEAELWLDPVDANSPSIANSAGGAFGTIIEGFGLRQSNDYIGSQIVDNVVVATTFEEALAGSGTPNFLEADFNEDTFVNGVDLDIWETNFGLAGSASKSQGDADSDLTVSGTDFLVWQSQYGQAAPPAVSAVPEPATFVFFAMGTVLLSRLRRRYF